MADKNTLQYSITRKGETSKTDVFDVIGKGDIWQLGKTKIIGLVGVQKIAEQEGIVEKKFTTEVSPTDGNKQQHCVNIWVGFKGDADPDNWVRGSGEASMLNTGKSRMNKEGKRMYDEFNSVDSKYRFSMADKRAYCRAILKLVKLFGVYSDVEAEEFAKAKPDDDCDY